MINSLLGIKKNMTSTYDSRGRRVGATVVQISPNFITQIKTLDGKDGYNAMQLGFGTKKSVKKPQLGLGKKIGIEKPIRWLREIKVNQGDGEDLKPGQAMSKLSLGQEINLDQVFSIGDAVKVTGTSKGKGFQGGMRRHGFHGGPRTHGQSDRQRAPGAISSGTTPGRVRKGKKMAGHMGNTKSSVKNLEVVGIEKEKNLLTLKGAIPGSTGGLVLLTNVGRIKGYTPPPEEKPEEESESLEESKESGVKEAENVENKEVKEEAKDAS